VAEFVRAGYEVCLADDGRYAEELASALAALGVGAPPRYERAPATKAPPPLAGPT